MKRGLSTQILISVLAILLLVSPVLAQETAQQAPEFETNPGITPDSLFYFIEDVILTKFRSDFDNKDKKVAEVMQMLREGNVDAAREALQRYNEYAQTLEKEIDPEKKEAAEKSKEAIKHALEQLQEKAAGHEEEFIDEVIKQEEKIVTAVKLADKINTLCEELAKEDIELYVKTCKADEDAPEWQKQKDKERTQKIEQDAKLFAEIMFQCHKDPKECECEKIPIASFAELCTEVIPHVIKCDEEEDEDACRKVDEFGSPMEYLPDEYKLAVMKEMRKYGMELDHDDEPNRRHLSDDCIDRDITDPAECALKRFIEGSPDECKKAIEDGRIDKSMIKTFDDLPKAGEECGRIMYELDRPDECKDINDPEECARMFKEHFQGHEQGPHRPAFDPSICMTVENDEERLNCFEKAVEHVQSDFHYEEFPCLEGQLFVCDSHMCSCNDKEQLPPDCIQTLKCDENSFCECQNTITHGNHPQCDPHTQFMECDHDGQCYCKEFDHPPVCDHGQFMECDENGECFCTEMPLPPECHHNQLMECDHDGNCHCVDMPPPECHPNEELECYDDGSCTCIPIDLNCPPGEFVECSHDGHCYCAMPHDQANDPHIACGHGTILECYDDGHCECVVDQSHQNQPECHGDEILECDHNNNCICVKNHPNCNHDEELVCDNGGCFCKLVEPHQPECNHDQTLECHGNVCECVQSDHDDQQDSNDNNGDDVNRNNEDNGDKEGESQQDKDNNNQGSDGNNNENHDSSDDNQDKQGGDQSGDAQGGESNQNTQENKDSQDNLITGNAFLDYYYKNK